jgi:hypothetical protein
LTGAPIFCAYTANRITACNALVLVEDLRTRNMTASASGTPDRPGCNVRGESRAQPRDPRHWLAQAGTAASPPKRPNPQSTAHLRT